MRKTHVIREFTCDLCGQDVNEEDIADLCRPDSLGWTADICVRCMAKPIQMVFTVIHTKRTRSN